MALGKTCQPSGAEGKHALHIAGDEVDLEVYGIPRLECAERRVLDRVGDQVDAEFSIDAAPLGYYDVYVGAGHYDPWTGNCINQGWWVLTGGFQVTGPTGLKDPDNSVAKPFVYRNPFTGTATLSFSNPGGKKFNLSVLDSYGRLVYKTIMDGDHAELNRQNIKPGIYFYRLEGIENQILYNGKFIIPE